MATRFRSCRTRRRAGSMTSMPLNFKSIKSSPQTPSIGKNFDEVLRAEITDPDRKSFRELRKEIQQDKRRAVILAAKKSISTAKLRCPWPALSSAW